MNKITTLGIDLAKSVFQVASFNPHGKLVKNSSMSRAKFKRMIVNYPSCLIGMEACGSAHYWAKVMTQLGHRVKLLPPAYVKGFVYGNKHDINDAKAIGLAVMQPEAPVVQVKTQGQLKLQALLRIRERRVQSRTRCANQMRGLLYEHGVVIRTGIRFVRTLKLAAIPIELHAMISELLDEFKLLDQQVKQSELTITTILHQHPAAERLMAIPGFGLINTLATLVNNPADFNNGRHYAAYLGLVPRQTGTGGKTQLQGLSKRGNSYQRKLLCEGAGAFLNCSKDYQHPLYQWAKRIEHKKGKPVAIAALANKLARISYHVLRGQHYQANHASQAQ